MPGKRVPQKCDCGNCDGRDFDGGYAEFTCVPAENVQMIKTELPPKGDYGRYSLLQRAWGPLFKALKLQKGHRLLVRGGSISSKPAAPSLFLLVDLQCAIRVEPFSSETPQSSKRYLEGLAQQIKAGRMKIQIGKVFRLDDIVEAHRIMEENRAGGKIVVLP